ncbi:hypothetical protein [Burkholderia territorii]|nr:hypothetical protein [Burkholderia territorii]
MKQSKDRKPMPLWAIWLISLVSVIAWCGINGEPAEQSWPIHRMQRA